MIENQIAQQLLQEQLQRERGEQVPPPNEASEGDAQHFQQAMANPNETGGVQNSSQDMGVEQVQPTEQVHQNAVVDNGPASGTPGDGLLASMDRMRTSHAGKVDAIKDQLAAGGELSVSDLLRAQMEISQVTFEQEIASKAAGKATQGLDSLLKGQ